jgi:hypothetical protein
MLPKGFGRVYELVDVKTVAEATIKERKLEETDESGSGKEAERQDGEWTKLGDSDGERTAERNSGYLVRLDDRIRTKGRSMPDKSETD